MIRKRCPSAVTSYWSVNGEGTKRVGNSERKLLTVAQVPVPVENGGERLPRSPNRLHIQGNAPHAARGDGRASLALVCYIAGMNDTLTIRLGRELAEALREEAHQTGVSRGEIVRHALDARLRPQGRLRVMSRYFGVMRGPVDLSTNRSYRRLWNKKPG